MPATIESRAKQIKQLEEEIAVTARLSVKQAIKFGGLLTEQKAAVGHGNWMAWVKEHLRISHGSVDNYMKTYERRDKIKLQNVTAVRL